MKSGFVARCVAVAAAAALIAVLLIPAPASVGARSSGAYLAGAEAWTDSDCEGQLPIVVGSDAAAQSDFYSAVTLAAAVGTRCIILAGARDEDISQSQQQRLEAANEGGYVVGGNAAVPAAKTTGRAMIRIAGADRWITAQPIGAVAVGTDPMDVPNPPSKSGSVRSAGAHIRGGEGWFSSDCAGQVPVVVASDTAAQSDIYSAVTLAGVIGTVCVILAGARNAEISQIQEARLDAANARGYVVGGDDAVPATKIAHRTLLRIAGSDRWGTAQQVGQEAKRLGITPITTTTTTTTTIATTTTTSTTTTTAAIADPDLKAGSIAEEVEMLSLVNDLRNSLGLEPLANHDGLAAVARAWSQHMAETGQFHHNPRFFEQYPPGFWGGGENIAWGYVSVQSAFNGWKNSPGHYRNMVDPNFTHIGVGIVGTYYTQNFGAAD